MKWISRIGLGVLVIAFTFTGTNALGAERIVVAGSGACQVLLRDMAAAFMNENPGVVVEVPNSVGSGGAVKAAADGSADLGRMARPLRDKESGLGLEFMPFANSLIVFTAHPSVPSLDLTPATAKDIFTGKIQNWKEVGGPDKRIRVIARHAGEASFSAMKKILPGWKDLEITSKSKMATTDQDTTRLISETESAIGFLPLAEAKSKGLTVMTLEGKQPTDEGYPLAGPFGFTYKPEKMTGTVKEFVDFVFSAKGAEIIKANYASPVKR